MKHSLYIIHEEGAEMSGPTKIGTAVMVGSRLRSLQCGNPRRLRIYDVFTLEDKEIAIHIEKSVLLNLDRVAWGRDWVSNPAKLAAEVVEQVLVQVGCQWSSHRARRRERALEAMDTPVFDRTAAGRA